MADAQVRAVITADDRASTVVAGFGSSFTRMTGAVTAGIAIFRSFQRVISGVTNFVQNSVQAYFEAENAQVRLKGAIQNVTSATNKNVDGLLKQASALQEVTRFSDDQIVSAQGILATFQLNQGVIEKLTPRLIDMSEGLARASGTMPDLETNAMLVAKALGGNETEGLVGALRRNGVQFTKTQEEILKTGNFADRLSTITKVLDGNFGDLGETMGNTASGKFMQLQFAINDLQEQLGAALFTAIRPFIRDLTAWARTDRAREVIKQIADRIVAFGRAAYKFIKENWEPTIKPALQGFATVVWSIARGLAAVSRGIQNMPKIPDWMKRLTNTAGNFAPGPAVRALLELLPGKAMGGPVTGGSPYIVGEKGPELFVPGQSGRIIPNGAGSTINLSVNVGVYAGTELEKRKLAESLLNSMKDIASSRNQSLSQMMS